eukprot:150996-Prorocentrum_minimum.AAC.1
MRIWYSGRSAYVGVVAAGYPGSGGGSAVGESIATCRRPIGRGQRGHILATDQSFRFGSVAFRRGVRAPPAARIVFRASFGCAGLL